MRCLYYCGLCSAEGYLKDSRRRFDQIPRTADQPLLLPHKSFRHQLRRRLSRLLIRGRVFSFWETYPYILDTLVL